MKKIVVIFLSLTSTAVFSQVEKDTIANKLDEVVIQSKTKTFTNKNGNLKIDVANSIYNSIPNVLDLLAKLPKIQISANRESLSVIGKGNPLIYIDNAKAEINDLESLSPADIKSIEIINNPSAKYEADGKVVILITRKFSKKEGFQVNLSDVGSFKKAFNHYSGIDASLKKGKTEFKANFNANELHPWESNSNDYTIESQNIESNYLVGGFTKRQQYIFGGSILQQLNADDYVSVSFNGKSQSDNFRFGTQTFNAENDVENMIETVGNNWGDKTFLNAIGNYSNKIKKSNANFFAGVQYSQLIQGARITSFNNYNDTQFLPFRQSEHDFTIDAFSAKSDFDKKFTNEMKLESGILYAATIAKTNLDMNDSEQNVNSVSDYRLEEQNTAMYATLSGSVKKVTWSVGLRAEITDIVGKYKSESNPLVDKNYTNLFPKIEVGIAIDSLKTITFNYNKSISRPDYSSASNNATYVNPYFIFTGNPNLNPSISDELSAVFQYRDKTLKASYFQTKDLINNSFLYDPAQHLLTNRPENFNLETGYAIEFTVPLTYEKWRSTNILSTYLDKIEDSGAAKGKVKPFLYYYFNQMFTLPKDFTISATFWGMTKRYQGVLLSNDFFIMDVTLAKTYKKFTCSISANDIFRNMNFREKFAFDGVKTVANYYTDTREFSISLKYKFGKIKESNFEAKSVNENTERMR